MLLSVGSRDSKEIDPCWLLGFDGPRPHIGGDTRKLRETEDPYSFSSCCMQLWWGFQSDIPEFCFRMKDRKA